MKIDLRVAQIIAPFQLVSDLFPQNRRSFPVFADVEDVFARSSLSLMLNTFIYAYQRNNGAFPCLKMRMIFVRVDVQFPYGSVLRQLLSRPGSTDLVHHRLSRDLLSRHICACFLIRHLQARFHKRQANAAADALICFDPRDPVHRILIATAGFPVVRSFVFQSP